jgi:ABC-type transport system involved in multi-copper enzyme maturation permease subunit
MTATNYTDVPAGIPGQPGPPARHAVTRRAATFADALRSEWIKLTTLRSTWITLLVTVLLGVGLGTLISFLGANHYNNGNNGRPDFNWNPTEVSLRGLLLAQVAVAVLGVMVVTGEYSSGMIRTSLAATPRRVRFLLSKFAVWTAVALVVGEIVSFAAFFLGQLVIGNQAPHTTIGAHLVLRSVIGAGLYLAMTGLLATVIGALLRNTAAGISAMVGLLFVLPGIIAALPSSWSNPIGEYWPVGPGSAGAQVYAQTTGSYTLSAWTGYGVMALFTAILLGLALWTIQHRDA